MFNVHRGALQSIEMQTQQVVSKPCAAEVAQAAALPGADPAAAEGQTTVGSSTGTPQLILGAHARLHTTDGVTCACVSRVCALTVLLVSCTGDAGAFQAVTANFSFLYSASELAVSTSEVMVHCS